MKQNNLPSYDSRKKAIIAKYPDLDTEIKQLEKEIIDNPADGINETLIIEGRHVKTHKRWKRASLFSDRLPDCYMYLTINYGITVDGTVVFLAMYIHDYIV